MLIQNVSHRYSQNPFDRSALLSNVLEGFALNPKGIHGVSHWARVRYHGLRIGREKGANLLLIELFAYLHDSCRQDDYADPHHGLRAADYAQKLNGRLFNIDETQMEQLAIALEGHSQGAIHTDVTIQTCWDADRLDLVRLNISPDPEYLSVEAVSHIERARDLYLGRYKSVALHLAD